MELNINAIVSVSCEEVFEKNLSSEDTEQLEIENRFYELAEEGNDEKALVLSSFEGDIANGGFEQLFLNKDNDFINAALELLQTIGAKEKCRLSKEAIQVYQKYSQTISEYTELQRILADLEGCFDSTKENIPMLYYEKFTF